MTTDQQLLPPPTGYQCPLNDEYLQLLNQAIELEMHQAYTCQQAGMCDLPVGDYQANSARRLQLFRALKAHFFPRCP